MTDLMSVYSDDAEGLAMMMADDAAPVPMPVDITSPRCPRCGLIVPNGVGEPRPTCADNKPSGGRWSHAETCALYARAWDLCDPCTEDLGWPTT